MGNPGETAKDTPSERVRVKPDVFMAAQLIEMNDHLANLEDILSGRGRDVPCEDLTCNLVVTKKGAEGTVPPPAELPAPVPAPEPAKPPAPPPEYSELIKEITSQHKTFQEMFEKLTSISDRLAISQKPETEYYITPQTAITVSTQSQPNSPDVITDGTSPGYQSEPVYTALDRIAPSINVVNDGTVNLYVISSPDGKTWSAEVTIAQGETHTFYNVWELRLRAPTLGQVNGSSFGASAGPGGVSSFALYTVVGGFYRVSELPIQSSYAAPAPNRLFINTQNVAVAQLPAQTTVTLNVNVPNGIDVVFRAAVTNTQNIFISGTDATNPAKRITLAPGDVTSYLLAQHTSILVASTFAGQTLDITSEL